jgi:phosphoglycerate dehydrogenase-like enzyme
MKKLHVHYGYTLSEEALAILRDAVVENVSITHGGEVPETATVLVHGRPPREMLAAAPIQHVIIPWAGVSPALRELVQTEFPQIRVHNLHHNAVPVAEMVFTLLTAAARLTIPFDRKLRGGDWTPRYSAAATTQLLAGKTMLILGYGAIGQEVAKRCAPFDITVLGTRRNPDGDADPFAAEVHPAAALPELLPRAEILCICLPLTPETEGLIGADELARLPERAILINIGRGEIVQEEALYAALRDGRLHAAGLDVWYTYPRDEADRAATPPTNLPFHELENVVMSPHRSGLTDGTDWLRMTHLARLLNAAARGEAMPNQVDLTRGY